MQFLCLLGSCKNDNLKTKEFEIEDPVLVKVKNRTFSSKDFEQYTGRSIEQASTEFKEKYIDQWIKEQLILIESSPSSVQNDRIDQLVKNYRNTLLIENHKQKLISNQVNLKISAEEMDSMYQQMQGKFHYQRKLIKADLIRVPVFNDALIDLKVSFKENRWDEFYRKVEENMDFLVIDSTQFSDWKDFQLYLPEEIVDESSIKPWKNYEGTVDSTYYFLKVYDIIDKNEIPPFNYMEDKIQNTIVHKRVKVFLDNYEKSLYKKALQLNQIKIYD